MEFQSQKFTLRLIDEKLYTPGSSDNHRMYSREYHLGDPQYKPSVCYGVTCEPGNADCVIIVQGGATAVNSGSVIMGEEACWIAIGECVVSLALPSLEKKWHQRPGHEFTCFELFFSPDKKGILVHGELQISKITFDGDLVWSASGKDIFTGDFLVKQNHIIVSDFNDEIYHINIEDGDIVLI